MAFPRKRRQDDDKKVFSECGEDGGDQHGASLSAGYSTQGNSANQVNMDEYEFEVIDFYDPTAENVQSAIDAYLGKLSIRGRSDIQKKKIIPDIHLDTNQNCGRGVPFFSVS
ncbi:MAG: hypothetical protein LBF93_06120 [Zoogloeaceae bacterium]|jgi:hypothetical protein|nr:hypothetical protein [Zoogloeaceae bacterium]